jgi:hypothetical protein
MILQKALIAAAVLSFGTAAGALEVGARFAQGNSTLNTYNGYQTSEYNVTEQYTENTAGLAQGSAAYNRTVNGNAFQSGNSRSSFSGTSSSSFSETSTFAR